ncbi:hypothetical protein [Clostridium sp. JS66]|uniref:hypothetical protein n=1 Tax=Clostridium sp. JS66 TaxID=3064705 RepID=UPI00298D97B3|nr:hypothetical protein [Clostridium sp. JS66]WPC39518.1 hypothetical protein Q6H37_16530 [Clostridium sp. JS66]
MLKNKNLQMGGIYREDFIKYFLEIGGMRESEQIFKGEYWKVDVGSQTWKKLGALKIQHVLIKLSVEEDKFDDFLAEFRLNFLRAGG